MSGIDYIGECVKGMTVMAPTIPDRSFGQVSGRCRVYAGFRKIDRLGSNDAAAALALSGFSYDSRLSLEYGYVVQFDFFLEEAC